jgi:UDP-glucose 4-epimerase
MLSDRGAAVAVIDNLASGLSMPTVAARPVVADIRDAERIEAVCRAFKPSAIIHLAAVHHIPTCEELRAYSLDVNIVGTETVLKAAERSGVGKVVLASSGAVYAWDDAPLDEETTDTAVADNYSLAKIANEHQVKLWSARCGGVARIGRIFNTIGSGDPNAHLIPDILDQISRNQAEVLLGNLTPKRDYVYVDDVATALIALLDDDRRATRVDVFNICSGTEISVDGLAQEIASLLRRSIRVRSVAARARPVDRPRQLGSNRKLASSLGWRPTWTLQDSLRAIVDGTR